MLKRTRVSSSMDTRRLGQAVSYPGIDPRIWVSLGFALGESVVDPDHGVFVDVELMPDGRQVTCRVATDYAGPGFGLYLGEIHKDDEVVVEFPSGDPAEGGIITKRPYSASDLPPQEAIDDPTEVMLVVQKDRNLRFKVSGGGKVMLDCATVEVGDVAGNVGTLKVLDGSKSVTIAEHLRDLYALVKAAYDNHTHATGVGPSGPPGPPGLPALPGWNSAIISTKVTIPDG